MGVDFSVEPVGITAWLVKIHVHDRRDTFNFRVAKY